MAGFMNAELEALRNNLKCGHCDSAFQGVDWQARKVKYEQRVVYCSDVCSKAASSNRAQEQAIREGKKPRKGVLCGPCKTCGNKFESKIDKMFCSMDCYIKSDQFREMAGGYFPPSAEVRAKTSEQMKKGKDVPCLECGVEFYQKRPSKGKVARKFCGTPCYRTYLSKRFDRWVANPEGMALPQCYDEFLDREELTCVVDGCNWHGQHLTTHMNQAHGVVADEFKRAAGFNLGTGVIARPLAEALRDRVVVGVAAGMDANSRAAALELAQESLAGNYIRYKSLEGKEHTKKSRSMLGPGPHRICAGCSTEFQQSTPMGRALYCSSECRDHTYLKERRAIAKHPVRQKDGTLRWESSAPSSAQQSYQINS